MSFASGALGCMNMRFKDVSQKRGQSVEITKNSRSSAFLGWAFPYQETSAIYIDACISAPQRFDVAFSSDTKAFVAPCRDGSLGFSPEETDPTDARLLFS